MDNMIRYGWSAELFEKFAQGIKENKNHFMFEIQIEKENNPRIYSVIVDNVLGAKYVYSEYEYDKEYLTEKLVKGNLSNRDFSMLVKDDNYIIDEHIFKVTDRTALPDNIKTFISIRQEYDALYETEMKKFYNDIVEVDTNFSEENISDMKYDARYFQFYNLNVFDTLKCNTTKKKLSYSDILKAEIGYTQKEEVIKNIVKSNEKELIWLKSKAIYIENLIANNEVVEQWELDIVRPLIAIKDIAKTANVTFELNGITGTEKININNLIDCIFDKKQISCYEFSNFSKGRELLNKLNASYRLAAESIVKITYNKNVLFEK
jgi:hypothetical protein